MTEKFIWRDEMVKALQIYQSELRDFLYKPATPTMISHVENKIRTISEHYMRIDRNPVWEVPVKVVTDGYGSFELTPDLTGVTLREKPRIFY